MTDPNREERDLPSQEPEDVDVSEDEVVSINAIISPQDTLAQALQTLQDLDTENTHEDGNEKPDAWEMEQLFKDYTNQVHTLYVFRKQGGHYVQQVSNYDRAVEIVDGIHADGFYSRICHRTDGSYHQDLLPLSEISFCRIMGPLVDKTGEVAGESDEYIPG